MQGIPNCPGCAALSRRLGEVEAQAQAQAARLEARIAELEERLKLNSQNSSKPPSSDPPWNKQTGSQPRSRRRRGGQPGHEGHFRGLVPAERVTKRVPYFPKQCSQCGNPLPQTPQADAPEPTRHQVFELPKEPLEVTQYEGWSCRCGKCGHVTQAAIPPEISAHTLGPRLTTAIALLTALYHISTRQVQGFLATALGAPLGLGSIP